MGVTAREQANTFKKHRDAEDPQGNLTWAARLQQKALRAGPEALARIDVEREFELTGDEKIIWRLLKLARRYVDLEHTGVLPVDKIRGFLRGLVAADVVDIVEGNEAKALVPAEVKRIRAELAGKEIARPTQPLRGKVYRPDIDGGSSGGGAPGPTAPSSSASSSAPSHAATAAATAVASAGMTSSSAGFQTIPPESRASSGGNTGAHPPSAGPPPVNLTPTRTTTTTSPGRAPAPAPVSVGSEALDEDERAYKKEIERAHAEMAKQDHYEFMGLHPSNIDDSAVRQAWMRLAREYHPDRVAGGALSTDAKLKSQVEALFRRLNEAHEAIGNADARSAYDRNLEALGAGAVTSTAGKRQRRPMEANNAFRMAETFFKKKELKQAEAHYRQAVAFDPEDPKLLTALAVCIWLNPDHDEKERTADARKRLSQVVDEHRHADAAYRLGLLLRKGNDEAGAQRQFALANKLDPTHVEALREVRLTEMRHQKGKDRAEAEKGGLLGKLGLKK